MSDLQHEDIEALFPHHPDPDACVQGLRTYESLLRQYAPQINLVAVGDLDALTQRHILPALLMAREIQRHPHNRILDVGSGAGLPGIPLALAIPTAHVVLVEARRRRANFLRHCTRTIPLPRVAVEHSRVELLTWDAPFDVSMSRAVSGLDGLETLTAHAVRRGGHFVCSLAPDEHPAPPARSIDDAYQQARTRIGIKGAGPVDMNVNNTP